MKVGYVDGLYERAVGGHSDLQNVSHKPQYIWCHTHCNIHISHDYHMFMTNILISRMLVINPSTYGVIHTAIYTYHMTITCL